MDIICLKKKHVYSSKYKTDDECSPSSRTLKNGKPNRLRFLLTSENIERQRELYKCLYRIEYISFNLQTVYRWGNFAFITMYKIWKMYLFFILIEINRRAIIFMSYSLFTLLNAQSGWVNDSCQFFYPPARDLYRKMALTQCPPKKTPQLNL